eukprot:scaffold202583_cov29-Tisochrysis_lutea.AAC.3
MKHGLESWRSLRLAGDGAGVARDAEERPRACEGQVVPTRFGKLRGLQEWKLNPRADGAVSSPCQTFRRL